MYPVIAVTSLWFMATPCVRGLLAKCIVPDKQGRLQGTPAFILPLSRRWALTRLIITIATIIAVSVMLSLCSDLDGGNASQERCPL